MPREKNELMRMLTLALSVVPLVATGAPPVEHWTESSGAWYNAKTLSNETYYSLHDVAYYDGYVDTSELSLVCRPSGALNMRLGVVGQNLRIGAADVFPDEWVIKYRVVGARDTAIHTLVARFWSDAQGDWWPGISVTPALIAQLKEGTSIILNFGSLQYRAPMTADGKKAWSKAHPANWLQKLLGMKPVPPKYEAVTFGSPKAHGAFSLRGFATAYGKLPAKCHPEPTTQ